MKVDSALGMLHGTWALSSVRLTMVAGNFSAYGVTNVLPTTPALQDPVYTITHLTASNMSWRDRLLRPGMKLTRLGRAAPFE